MTQPSNPDIYQLNGFPTRADYLTSLAEQAGNDEHAHLIWAAADLLGPEEDFDGLITALQNYGVEI